ncbi:hypothetical protein HY605_02280 [Candidatus Peregrinibacteria bacterium]|nr:hypothetical protein [Candidatus Peregrinibacteria bacterium]
MQEKIDIFSKLLRDIEAEVGTSEASKMVLISLMETIKAFKADSCDTFCAQFEELVKILSNTEPKFGVLNYHFAVMLKRFKAEVCGKDVCGVDEKKWKTVVLGYIEAILKESRDHKRNLISNAEKLDVEGKTILIHDHSHTVQDVLVHYKRMGKHFKVVIAEQDFDKTHSNIEKMDAAKISFQVVPAYMLSHIHKHIDMLFFGGLTLKNTMHFVMDPGTHSIISEFNVEHVPVYMFMDTAKFSLWKSKPRGEIFIHQHTRMHVSKPIEYERIKYSHDRVPSSLFAKIITNEGVFDQKGLKALYQKKFDEYAAMKLK